MDSLSQFSGKYHFGWTRSPPIRKKAATLAAALAVLFMLIACSPSGKKVTLLVTVGSELVDCAGAGPEECLVVNGEPFYDTIEGFDFEEGFYYRLTIEREDMYPDEEPPQDTSRYRYRLIEVLSKTVSPRR